MGRNVPVTVYLENIAKIGYKEKALPTVNDGATHQDLGTDKCQYLLPVPTGTTDRLASADAELVKNQFRVYGWVREEGSLDDP